MWCRCDVDVSNTLDYNEFSLKNGDFQNDSHLLIFFSRRKFENSQNSKSVLFNVIGTNNDGVP